MKNIACPFLACLALAATVSMSVADGAAPRTLQEMRREAETAVRQKRYAEATEIVAAVRSSPDVTPNDFCWAWKMEADQLSRDGRTTEARAKYEKLYYVGSPVDALWGAAKTFKGGDGYRRYAYLDMYLEKDNPYRCPLTEREKRTLWDKYAYDAFVLMEPGPLRKGREMSLRLGGKGGEHHELVAHGVDVWDDLEHFPLDEKDVHFPKTIGDFGVKVRKTVHVARDFGFDPTNATAFIEAAITSGAQRVVVENVGRPWYVRKISLPSNVEIVLEDGVRIHTDRTWDEFAKGGIFSLSGVSNVVIRGASQNGGAVISQFHDLMDRARNCRTYGRSAITITGSRHVAIRDLTVAESACDAVVFTGSGGNRDMYLENVDLASCFRQASSFCDLDRGFFKNVRFRDTAGAEPGAGIDLEPWDVPLANSSLYLYDCVFENNMGGGLVFATSSEFPITLHAKRCLFKPHRNGALKVFIRIGIYLGLMKKVPGRAIFEDCEFQGYSDSPPVRIEGVPLLDLEFRRCRITDSGAISVDRNPPDAPAVEFVINRDVYYEGFPGAIPQPAITFEECSVKGYTNAPPVGFRNLAGHVSIGGLDGAIDFNGQSIDLKSFRHTGPDRAFKDIPGRIPALDDSQAAAAPPGKRDGAFTFRWGGNWWDPRPVVTYLFHGVKGASARLLLRFGGDPAGDRTIRVTGQGEGSASLELGEYGKGDNELSFAFPSTGWYSITPPANHVLVEYEGIAPVYSGCQGKKRSVQLDAPQGYVGYFEVPAGGQAVFKVEGGSVALRDASGKDAGVVECGRRRGAGYARLRSKSGKPEIWSFTVRNSATVKFFAPFSGLWADTPEAVPSAPDAIRSPVMEIEREVAEDAVPAEAADLKSFLAARPEIARIVTNEMARRVEWAKKGDYAALLRAKEEQLAKMRASAANEQQRRETEDEERNVPPLRERADMERRILAMTPDELERYSFCHAFAVVRGIRSDPAILDNFVRCLADGDDMPSKYPVVYWWIYKKNYDDYIRRWVAEFGLGFSDFTLICDDDAKLDKLIPILEGYLAPATGIK